jgi:hypothetical protein
MKSTIFWYVMSCNLVEFYRYFGGKNLFHLKVQKLSYETNQQVANSPEKCILQPIAVFFSLSKGLKAK